MKVTTAGRDNGDGGGGGSGGIMVMEEEEDLGGSLPHPHHPGRKES